MCPGCMTTKRNKSCNSCKVEKQCKNRILQCKYKIDYNYCEEECTKSKTCLCYNS